jgi:type II pantothenate kinase
VRPWRSSPSATATGIRIPTEAGEQVAREIESLEPERVGVTGGGASRLAERLALDGRPANEFEAWAVGAHAILHREGRPAPERFLLVSVGTGTSAMLVDETGAVRVGGTALGGGTLAGLATVLVGTADFDSLTRLAREGDRRHVDLLVDDLTRAILGLVGENVTLLCGGLAVGAGVAHILYGGGTLRGTPALTDILRAVAPAHACEATILRDGEFTGALGALELAATAGP